MKFEEEHFVLNDYKSYDIFDEEWNPIEYININHLIIRNKYNENEWATINREYHDGYITIMKIQYHDEHYESLTCVEEIISHTPEMIKELIKEINKNKKIIDDLIHLLKMRGHKNIKCETRYRNVNWEKCQCELITQIDTIFPISNQLSFKEGKEIIKQEGEFLKATKPEIWGCFQYKGDYVFKNFRILFDEATGKFVRLSDFE